MMHPSCRNRPAALQPRQEPSSLGRFDKRSNYFEDRNPPALRLKLAGETLMEVSVRSGGRFEGGE
jgi:hypothetical protein